MSEFAKAMCILKKELKSDDQYRHSWQSNIAMSMSDALSHAGYKLPDQHKLCNEGALIFLNIFLND